MKPRVSRQTTLDIRACRDVYQVRDVCRHFGVHGSTVRRIWADDWPFADMPGGQVPNIWDTYTSDDIILADTQILLDRELTLTEVAEHFRVSPDRITRVFAEAGRRYFLRNEISIRHSEGNRLSNKIGAPREKKPGGGLRTRGGAHV